MVDAILDEATLGQQLLATHGLRGLTRRSGVSFGLGGGQSRSGPLVAGSATEQQPGAGGYGLS